MRHLIVGPVLALRLFLYPLVTGRSLQVPYL
jgi:hypothetical protein